LSSAIGAIIIGYHIFGLRALTVGKKDGCRISRESLKTCDVTLALVELELRHMVKAKAILLGREGVGKMGMVIFAFG